MKKLVIGMYLGWILVSFFLKGMGIIGWFVAFSWLWFPLAAALSAGVFLSASVRIGKWFVERDEKKIPDSCESCLFGHAAKWSKTKTCMGEVLYPDHKKGEMCDSYKRDVKGMDKNGK